MERPVIDSILSGIRKTRIAVVGDFCLDAYWILDGSGSERSLETGLPTRAVRDRRYSPGGAGNVAANLLSLGCGTVEVFGVIGADFFGSELRRLLSSSGAVLDGLLVQAGSWDTHVYIKPCESGVEQNRIDFGNFNRLDGSLGDRLLESLEERVSEVDLVVINQQVESGIHTAGFRKGIARIIGRHPERIFVVNSRHHSAEYPGAYRKVNEHEAGVLAGIEPDPDAGISDGELRTAVLKLSNEWTRPVVVTRGSRGSLVAESGVLTEIPGIRVASAIDTVGAGDSSVAGLSAALAAGCDVVTAARFGNLAAAVTVSKILQTGTATPEEILSR